MTDKEKKPYSKPEIERVKLVSEAVLVACKTETTGGGVDESDCVAGGCFNEYGS